MGNDTTRPATSGGDTIASEAILNPDGSVKDKAQQFKMMLGRPGVQQAFDKVPVKRPRSQIWEDIQAELVKRNRLLNQHFPDRNANPGSMLPHARGAAPIFPPFDPRGLPLTGWWRNFSVVPWIGSVSTGVSGTKNLNSLSVDPTVGAPLNGFGTASFNGTTSVLRATGTVGTYIAAKACCGWALINTAATGDILGDEGGSDDFSVGVGAAAANANLTINGGSAIATRAFTSGVWQLVTWRYQQSGAAQVGVNEVPGLAGGAAVAAFNTNIAGLTDTLSIGNNVTNFGAFNGLLADLGLCNQIISDADFARVKQYINFQYNLTL